MFVLDLSLPTPEENLALDEALLEWAEENSPDPLIRFWESPAYFAVLGYSCRVNIEVSVKECQKNNIPILRRPSGGGTVLQGPGCLNFCLIASFKHFPDLAYINRTNDLVMNKNQRALASILGEGVEVQGISDLTYKERKFSGNAQRRKKDYIMFHGTFLYNFDLQKISALLPIPPKVPDYREDRPHSDFLTNIPATSDQIKESLRKIWAANKTAFLPFSREKIEGLVKSKYSRKEWNFKF